MQVADPDAQVGIIFGQIFGQAFGQGGHQYPLVPGFPCADLFEQIIHLVFSLAYHDNRVDESGGPDDLLDLRGQAPCGLELARSCRNIDNLRYAFLEFTETQRAIIQRRRESETVFDQGLLAGPVAAIHGAQLRNGNVAFIDKK